MKKQKEIVVNVVETKKFPADKNAFLYMLIVLFILASGSALYFYKKINVLETNPQIQSQKETAELISKVSKIILLPEGELPSVATVSNPEELKSEAFFAKAKVGDKVLVYRISRKAFLYDPLANKILEVSSFTAETSQVVE